MGAMKKNPIVFWTALVLFAGWMVYLGVQAMRHRRPVVVSRAQLAVAQYDAEIDFSEWPPPVQLDSRGGVWANVKINKLRWTRDPNGPTGEIKLLTPKEVEGFVGPGTYLVPLVR